MTKEIFLEKGKYTMKESKGATPIAPAKYSPDDKYASYRRQVKKKEWEDAGLI